jgi:hypothetical protein
LVFDFPFADINYFHCLKIIEILKETEANTKNIFGSYRSQRMKDWQEIVHLYEKDNVYLAEAAQMLIRNVTYEVPSLKKQIAKCEQIQVVSLISNLYKITKTELHSLSLRPVVSFLQNKKRSIYLQIKEVCKCVHHTFIYCEDGFMFSVLGFLFKV